ncbi:ABC transporter permease [uncultured Sphaerochaeta sp.]|uniref:fluoroquinolone export ABC transporter permease subunit n=1 Tax=uncultured Sphaerochaeta sp. TaxID=886478 RepID=UPI002A0A6072|nr:ABC transporter permease [uncultured Sphaerochaeta sp.]
MRIKALLLGDIRFQWKYGFYFLYLIFSLFYIFLLGIVPEAWKQKVALIMVFSDPAAMGLFFMGAILLLEKSEQTLQSLAVSPVKPVEYVLAKLGSLALLSNLVGFCIALSATGIENPLLFFLGVFLGSCLFSAIGLLVATKAKTLNQFIVLTIPFELVINLPAFAYLFGWKIPALLLHPGVCILELCGNGNHPFLAIVVLLAWNAGIIRLATKQMETYFHSQGGNKE